MASTRGDAEHTVRLYAAADAFRRKTAFAIPPVATTARKRELDKASTALGDEQFQQIWQAAAEASLDDVAREALEGPAPLIEHVLKLSLDEGAEG
jgi:hypothetical protein